MSTKRLALLLLITLGTLAFMGCSEAPTLPASISSFALASTAFHNGGMLPFVYTCDGAGSSPPLDGWTYLRAPSSSRS